MPLPIGIGAAGGATSAAGALGAGATGLGSGIWSGISSIGSAILGGIGSIFGQSSANKANKKLAREQMAFQERMSNTAIQRRVEDLKAAGLNPMLAYMGEASSPVGARPEIRSTTRDVPHAVSSAVGAVLQRKQIEALTAQIRNTEADTVKKGSETAVNNETLSEIQARIPQHQASAAQAREQTKVLHQSLDKMVLEMNEIAARTRGHALSNELNARVIDIAERLKQIEERKGALGLKYLENEAAVMELMQKTPGVAKVIGEWLALQAGDSRDKWQERWEAFKERIMRNAR